MFSKIPTGVKVFALIWLLVACVPPLREVFAAFQVARSTATFGGLLPWGDVRWDQLAQKHPDDPRVMAVAIQSRWRDASDQSGDESDVPSNEERQRVQVRDLGVLASRFPDQLWLRASQLRFGTFRSFGIDAGRGFGRRTLSSKDRAELEFQVSTARNAARREPDNAFWPYIESVYEFALRDDGAALRALEAAGRCTRFNSYEEEESHQLLQAARIAREPLWEEKIIGRFVVGGTTMTVEQARKATENRWRSALKGGNNALALRWLGASLRLNLVQRHDETSPYTAFLAAIHGRETVLSFARDLSQRKSQPLGAAISALPGGAGGLMPDQREALYQEAAQQATLFARQQGRPNVALVITRAVRAPSPEVQQGLHLDFPRSFGLPRKWGFTFSQGPWFLIVIAGGAWAFGALCLLLSCLPRNGAHPARGAVTVVCSVAFWATLGSLAIAWQAGLGMSFFGLWGSFGDEENALALWPTLPLSAFGSWLLACAFATLWAAYRAVPLEPRDGHPLSRFATVARRIFGALTLVSGVLLASNGRGLWDRTPFDAALTAPIGVVSLGAFLFLEFWRLGRSRAFQRRFRREKNAGTVLERVGFGLQLVRLSAGVLSVMWSLVFLLGALSLWPLRAQLNAAFERRVHIGERAWVDEQVQAAKQAHEPGFSS